MVENRLTRSGPPPVRTLLHRGLPEPLPPRSTWPGRMMLWLPLVVVLIFTTPVTLMVLYDDESQDHPNLLPTYFDGDPRAAGLGGEWVRKPLYSREGANVEIRRRGFRDAQSSSGPYGAEGHVVQAYHPLPSFGGRRPVCGVWMVAGEPAGLGIREGDGDVTTDAARFVPHAIVG